MSRGFVCDRCDQLYEEHPGECVDCGHDGMETLTFSEYRDRRRTGEVPVCERESDGSIQRLLSLF